MQQLLAHLVTRRPWFFVAIFSAITIYFGMQLPNAQLDTDMKSQLPDDLPTRVDLQKIESVFGGTDMAMIVVSADDILEPKTLQRVQKLSEGLENIEDFDRVISLFTAKDIRSEDDEMLVEPAVGESLPEPGDTEALAQLRSRLVENPLVHGNIVSKDFKHTALIGFLKLEADDGEVVAALEQLIAETPGPGTAMVGGMPLTRVNLTKDMRKDMRVLVPVGLLIMLVFLFVCFRQARGVALPFIMTVMAIVVAMGLVPVLGWKIHTVTVLLPVILLAVANDYGIHVLARYQEDNAPGTTLDSPGLARSGILELARPIMATGITTMAGLLCLVTHIIIPAEQLGILAAVGVGFAVLGSLTFIPAILTLLPKAKPVIDTEGAKQLGLIDRLLFSVAAAIPKRPKTIVLACVLVCAAVGSGASRLVVDTNPMSFYKQTQPVWQSTHVLNEHLGGWAGVSVIAQGDIKDPAVLRAIDELEQHLRADDLVGTTTSIAGVIRKMHQVMNGGDPEFDAIPESRELVAQYLLLYSMSGDSQDLEKLVDFEYKNAQLMAKVTDAGTRAASHVVDRTEEWIEAHPDAPFVRVGGFLDVMADMVGHIVRGQITSILLSILIVGTLVAVLMRSLVAGCLAMFPLSLALLLLFGIMGYAGIELNLITAMLSSIMIGVGVDYTIHFLWRYRDERAAGLEAVAAVSRTLVTSGRGIVFNAFSVLIGFAVLVSSAFFPVQFFGILVAISISACLIGALVVLPAIVLLLRPKFLEPRADSPSRNV